MEKSRETAIEILAEFEELLDKKGIKIPSKDRTGEKEEACLYGVEYYVLEDSITEILGKYFIKQKEAAMQKIAYLDSENSSNLDYENGEGNREKAVLEHDKTEIYKVEDFVMAFNDEFISDLGFIALVEEEVSEEDKKWQRITELEKKAKDKYIDCIAWKHVIEMLSEDEQEEYYKLLKKTKKEKR
jgi:hypothetical protein